MSREWRKRDELLPVVGIMYIDSAKSHGVLGQGKKCLMQRIGRRICPGSVFDCGYGTKVTFKFTVWQCQVAWWLRW